ncbi:aminodeoxychorismate synthase component I [Microbacterium sp. NPDC055910]|uniref:aminodeoxychorismate synthase component I n=1 Tax=Microbacterium sp. NPDC055910 TaxID=3345659 RepID=UPI0035E063EF
MTQSLPPVALPRWMDPSTAFAYFARRHTDVFWLDAGPTADSGWSWVGVGDRETDVERVRAVRCGGPAEPPVGGPLQGGWVGWLGYEDAAGRAGAPVSADDGTTPPEAWLRVRRFVAFDHTARRAWVFSHAGERDALVAGLLGAAPAPSPAAAPDLGPARVRHSPREYARLIQRCRDAIRAGDAYQLCLTTRFDVAASVDPGMVFRRLRDATPAHHGGLVLTGGHALASASPERFLEVSGGRVRTRPIKGTRPRGRDAATDAALARELRESEKERAENVMIVDLMRNDLSRVCEPGSVGVDGLLEVESYPAVHQLVSTVSGRLREDSTVGELLAATFPAGSMTGAPKLSAMTILHGLEGAPRGVFSGAFGWVGDDGALDLAMVIRSVVVHPGGAYVGAGGGITWRSDAADEVAEVGIKARGPLAALGAHLPHGW